ncbi:MAG: DUF58 domain-containing protein [Acidimicrobiales bacterium]
MLPLAWAVPAHARRLSYVAVAALAVAVVTRRPAFVAIAVPALVLLAGRHRPPASKLELVLAPSTARVCEGERLDVQVLPVLAADVTAEVLVHPSEGVSASALQACSGGGDGSVVSVVLSRWGHQYPGTVELVLHDRSHLWESHAFTPLPEVVCYPAPAHHRAAFVLGRLRSRSGEHVARSAGEGVEFAAVREYTFGDRQLSINWAATTRRGRLQVNTFAAERSQDVVLVVDASIDLGDIGQSTVDIAFRGALGVARTYLDARDRVGLVVAGTRVQWVSPGLGKRQYFRLMEAMVEGGPALAVGDSIMRAPPAALPPGASVIAFSPLLDARWVEMLRDMCERGFSVVVVDILTQGPTARRSRLDKLARRIWQLERQALIFSLRELGVAVVAWDGTGPVELPLFVHPREPRRARL